MSGFRVWLRDVLPARRRLVPGPSPAPGPRSPVERDPFVDGNNAFALAMYAQLRREPGNLLFSPFSIRTGLGMTSAGARGETANQMRETLGLPHGEAAHVAAAAIIGRLDDAGGETHEMAIANSLWGQDGAPVKAEFLELVTRHYGGALNLVDLRGSPDEARAAINHWVEDRTRQRIRNLLPQGSPSQDARLVLVNAVYFKGRWKLRFRVEATRDEPFHVEGGSHPLVPLMHQFEEMPYVRGDGFQAVELVYRGGAMSMVVFLPDHEDGLRLFEQRLSARMLDGWIAEMTPQVIRLFLPRFRMTWGTLDVSVALKSLGMTRPFDRSRADFSGISGHPAPDKDSLVVAAVYHQAFAEVSEEGTEAAAATAVLEDTGAVAAVQRRPVPLVRVDRPFLFVIRERMSGTILFLGRVADPTAGNPDRR